MKFTSRRMERFVMGAVEANEGLHPTQLLVELEKAIATMHGKPYGSDGLAAVMVDVLLCVVDPKFRGVVIDA